MLARMLGAGPAANPLGEAVLYFGCRRADQDFLYGDQLQAWLATATSPSSRPFRASRSPPTFTMHSIFSLVASGPGAECHACVVQARKVYVQDRVRDSGDWSWGCWPRARMLYVCGDAAGMAPAVEEALLDVVARAQGSGRPAAQQYLQGLAAAGRYQRDVWF